MPISEISAGGAPGLDPVRSLPSAAEAELWRLWSLVLSADQAMQDCRLPESGMDAWGDLSFYCQAQIAKMPCDSVQGVLIKARLLYWIRVSQQSDVEYEERLLTTALQGLEALSKRGAVQ